MKVGHHPYNDSETPFSSSFSVTVDDLIKIPEKYMKRKLDDDIEYITSLGGLGEICKKLKTTKDAGYNSADTSKERELTFGSNRPREVKRDTYWEICWEALGDLTLRILIVSGLISIILGSALDEHKEYAWIEGFAIIIAVVVVVNVTAVNDMQKQKKFLDLQEQNRKIKIVNLLRDGNWILIHPNELLVGDIIKVENGITIPADGILIEAHQVETLEASMTGENDNIKKVSYAESVELRAEFLKHNPGLADMTFTEDRHHDIPSPVVLSGTNLAEGFGIMVVIAVGKNSCEGRIVELAEQESESTPLMMKLDSLAESIGKGGLAAAIVTVLALFLRIIIVRSKDSKWGEGNPAQEFVQAFIIGITVLVVAIPEGLPLAVTISLAYSVKKMQKDNNLVRKMHACETMGGADMICSDKTGTLTQNKMTVSEFWAGGALVSFERSRPSHKTFQAEYLHLLKEAIFTNSSASIDKSGKQIGSKTEIAMLLLMQNFGHNDYEETRNIYKNRAFKLFPFSSRRKRSSIQISLENGSKRLHVKGASEVLAEKCTHFLTADGSLRELTENELFNVGSVIQDMTERALRVIALAYKDLKTEIDLDELNEAGFPKVEDSGLTLIGLAGIRDPIRDEVPEAVKKCQRAGITVRMVTGDNKATARAIAKECFIITSDEHIVMEGKEFAMRTGGTICKRCKVKACECPRTKADVKKTGKKIRKDVVQNFDSFKDLIKSLAVLARSSPDDKYTLVTGLKQLGHVVAVTGDGTNDAPALKKADIGFAMGIAGTEMAKEAAGIILLDDNFNSIVRAVVWGRNIYDNIRCFLQFQLTVNVVAVVLAMVGAITIQQSPLGSVQLLWVNLIMDSFASLALATDPPTDKHLERKPHKRKEFMIEKIMWKHIFGQAFMQLCVLFTMTYAGEYFLPDFYSDFELKGTVEVGRNYHFDGEDDYKDKFNDPNIGPSEHFTYIFNVFVLFQLTNEYNSRKLRDEFNCFSGLSKNWIFSVIWVGTFCVQIIIVSFGNIPFGCAIYGLSFIQWLVCCAFALMSFIWRLFLIMIPSGRFPQAGQREHEGVLGEGVLSFRGSLNKRVSFNMAN